MEQKDRRLHRLRWRLFAVSAALAVVGIAGFVAAVSVWNGPGSLGRWVDNLGQLAAAALAAAACSWAARRSSGRERLGWALLAASAASWAAGQTVWSAYALLLGVAIPYPSSGDIGFLAAVAFAFAGILCFWSPARGTAVRWRVWLDGAIIALALLFVAWAVGLNVVFADTTSSKLEKTLNLAYPIGDIMIGTVLILAIRRARHQDQGRMLFLLGGLAANSLSDTTFSLLSANNAYNAGDILDTGWVAGYLMIALAALWPRAAAARSTDSATIDLWQLVLPWLVVLGAAVTAGVMALSGRSLDPFMTMLVGVTAALLTLSMISANREAMGLLARSRLSEETLAEVIARAPAGVVRFGPDLRIIDANPAFMSILLIAGEENGELITRYMSTAEAAKFAEKVQSLSSGAGVVEGDSEAQRGDGANVWVHWIATAVPGAETGSKYFIAMFEDTTSRHQAEEAAASSLELVQRLNALKTEFLQSVSHEFKTALIGIQGFSEFMRDADELDVNDARAFAADIHRDAERLDRMVTEMLALDRVETTRANMRIEPVDINSVIEHEVAGAQAGTTARIAPELSPQLPSVAGDEEKLGLLVRTLLANAVRYSPEGGRITVTTSVAGETVTVSVQDEGMAARADFDNRLFGRDDLYADNPIRKVVGTGLGLGIVRQVVEMHGGRLWVDRVDGDGGGCVYRFTLQAMAAAPVPRETGGMVA